MNLDVHRILAHTEAEGLGLRFCIWVQGCSIHCEGCANPEMWEFGVGTKAPVKQLIHEIKETPGIEGVTFLGGEPFEQAAPLAEIAKHVRTKGLSVITFTGYQYEQLAESKEQDTQALLAQTDLLIDGPYRKERRTFSLPWVGSDNQRYWFLTNRYHQNQLQNVRNRFELHVLPNGTLEINGMGNDKKLKKLLQEESCWIKK